MGRYSERYRWQMDCARAARESAEREQARQAAADGEWPEVVAYVLGRGAKFVTKSGAEVFHFQFCEGVEMDVAAVAENQGFILTTIIGEVES